MLVFANDDSSVIDAFINANWVSQISSGNYDWYSFGYKGTAGSETATEFGAIDNSRGNLGAFASGVTGVWGLTKYEQASLVVKTTVHGSTVNATVPAGTYNGNPGDSNYAFIEFVVNKDTDTWGERAGIAGIDTEWSSMHEPNGFWFYSVAGGNFPTVPFTNSSPPAWTSGSYVAMCDVPFLTAGKAHYFQTDGNHGSTNRDLRIKCFGGKEFVTNQPVSVGDRFEVAFFLADSAAFGVQSKHRIKRKL